VTTQVLVAFLCHAYTHVFQSSNRNSPPPYKQLIMAIVAGLLRLREKNTI